MRQRPSFLGTAPKPEQRTQGSGEVGKGPRTLPARHSLDSSEATASGCLAAEARLRV